MRHIFIILITSIISLLPTTTNAEIIDPVSLKFSVDTLQNGEQELSIIARIEHGWHIYTNTINPDVGPTPFTITLDTPTVATGELLVEGEETTEYDALFDANLSWWSGEVRLHLPIACEPGQPVTGKIKYGACNDATCLPPTSIPFAIGKNTGKSAQTTTGSDKLPATWDPVNTATDGVSSTGSSGMLYIFIACFIGGLIALLTPCVWPMIPLTVSFFIKKSVSRARGIRDAIIYGLSIVVIYVALGLIITVLFGADQLNVIATSAVCNIIFFALLVFFAISFFGAFELKLPSKWADKMDSSAEKATGFVSIFFMAFTLAIVSFSCTGPIIGTLLVEAATTGSTLSPAIGMLGFSIALAIPFALFAMFPSWLKSAPKSGGWMNTVKVVLGFLELALSLKFLSVADLAYGWHILDRETFLALWIAIFILLGLYLLGTYAFKHYGNDSADGITTVRFFGALASLSFAVYLLPGLWGAPLHAVSAFVPPVHTQDFNLGKEQIHSFDNYDEGMAQAQADGKPVFVDFSGFGCVNCRKMESAVLNDSDVKQIIDDNFISITLMVDSRKQLPVPETIVENGKSETITTYGEKWSYLQRHKFGANAQPYYVILSPEGKLLSGPVAYDENIASFVAFLEKGIGN